MGFVKITNFFLDSFITSRINKLTERPAYDTCKETKIIRFDNILCWGFRVFHVRLEEEDTVMNSL